MQRNKTVVRQTLAQKKWRYWHKLHTEKGHSILEIASKHKNPLTGLAYSTQAIRNGIEWVDAQIAQNYESSTS